MKRGKGKGRANAWMERAGSWPRIMAEFPRPVECAAFPPAWFTLPANQNDSRGNLAQFTCKLFAVSGMDSIIS